MGPGDAWVDLRPQKRMPMFSPGQGLNSIRWRFATAGTVLAVLSLASATALTGELAVRQPRTWLVIGAYRDLLHE